MAIKTLFVFITAVFFCQTAKNSPHFFADRQKAFQRAKSLDKGISISWLDQTWNSQVLDKDGVTAADLVLLRQLGFRTIRLPVAFRYFNEQHIPQQEILDRIDRVWQLCRRYNFRLIIDYHYGGLTDQNAVSVTQEVINTWLSVTKKYLHQSYDDLFFEIYNEPPPINPQTWKDAAYNIVTALRKADPERTLLVGASNYNSIYELSRFVRLADENIIYTFHFYEPFLFTHQGASWVGAQVSTTGVPFPYNVEKFPQINSHAIGTPGEQNYNKYHLDGNVGSIKDKLQLVKNWGNKYGVPLICTEYGSFNQYADTESRCRYLKAMRSTLHQLGIPGLMWDYNTNFSIFKGDPALINLPDCMKDALLY